MNKYIFYWLLLGIATTMIAFSSGAEDNSTLHFFLLMVPESNIESLRRRVPRQEEGVGAALGAIGEAAGPAANVGQILQGVLGGDLRPIFAGSTAFIPEGDFREGVTEILQQTVAPAIQRILMEFNKNVGRHFNMTSTTPPPTQQPPNQNQLNQNNQNYNNFGNQYPPANQPVNQFQPNYNQFQQPSQANQQFGGGIGGAGVAGVGAAAAGAGNFNGQYNQLQNYQPNPPYQQPTYANQLQQPPPNYQTNQLNQFPPPAQNTNFQQPNYNQYQQGAPINNPIVSNPNYQAPVQAAQQPSFNGQIYQPPQQGSHISPPVPPQQPTFTQKFQPPPQSFPQPPNSNRFQINYVPNSPLSSNDEK